MATFMFKALRLKSTLRLVTSIICSLAFLAGNAQSRQYSLVFSDNIKGGTAIFGNTLMNIVDNGAVNLVKMNDNSTDGNSIYGNNKQNMQYVDIDGNSGNGNVTRNSSSAELLLPAGTNTIKLARLYWGGYIANNEFDLTLDVNKKIKLRKGTTNIYSDVNALAIDTQRINATAFQYQAFADITSFVKNNGAGVYEAGNVPLSAGSFSISGANGGWYIVVVYENPALSYNSVRFYDGFQKIYTLGNPLATFVTLTGLDVPSGTMLPGDATMGVVAWEGDANLRSDYLKINGNLFSNALNPVDNPWNGTISTNGVNVITRTPSYTNQMGLDIDQFDVGIGYGIIPNDNSVTLEFGAEADRYFPGAFTFTIKMKDPDIVLSKTVSDASHNGLGEANEILTYTLIGKNTGVGDANFVTVTDTLPATITFVPGSMNVINCPGVIPGIKTDLLGDDNADYIVNGLVKTVQFRLGTGSSGAQGGTLAANDSFEVQFKVLVLNPGLGLPVPSIMNIARMKAQSDAGVNFVDDATAVINAEGGPLPVSLISFKGSLQDNLVKLDWSTSTELNCSQYIVERSLDGKNFYQVSTIAGSGTTSSLHSYVINDDISGAASPIVYYRLHQLDLDKKGSYSKIIAVKIKTLNTKISISPNPFRNYLNINLDWDNNEIINAKVINAQGREVIVKNILMSKGLNYISLKELSQLPAGDYFIQFISSKERITKKISKQ